jgi:hypothetical protein
MVELWLARRGRLPILCLDRRAFLRYRNEQAALLDARLRGDDLLLIRRIDTLRALGSSPASRGDPLGEIFMAC